MTKAKILIIKIILLLAALCGILFLLYRIEQLRNENVRLNSNQTELINRSNALIVENWKYKVADSLNAIKVEALRLTLDEYKKYRSEDLALIKKLKTDKRDLDRVVQSQLLTIDSLRTYARDTVKRVGSELQPIKIFNYRSNWTDIDGTLNLNTNDVTIKLAHREAILVVESIEYKRFLGFLWKTKCVKSRNVNVLSRNPNTKIVECSYELIEK